MKYSALSLKEKQELARRLLTELAYSEQQREALAGRREMTQELFEQCLDTCVSIHDALSFSEVWEQFPNHAKADAEKTEEMLKRVILPEDEKTDGKNAKN